MHANRSRGFTLIEVLVALFVMAIISIAAFRGLGAVVDARDAVAKETRKWQALMFFFSRMEQDIALAVHRPVRDRLGIQQPEWLGHDVPVAPDDAQLILTRAGSPDGDNGQAGPQRVGYRLERDTLYILRWKALDAPPDAEPVRYPILEGVSGFHLRYLGQDGLWQEQWPAPGQAGGIPVAAEVTLTLNGGQPVTRLFLTR